MRLFFPLIAVSLVCLGLQFEPMASFAEWHRQAISQGQWWRIVSGNFTHTNIPHLAMNLAGLWVISFIFKPDVKSWLLALSAVSFSVGLLNLFSGMGTYVGLSGALHGLFVYYALLEVLNGRKSSAFLVLGIIAKVSWEMTMGAPQSTSTLIQARVAVEAHLFGLLSGLLFAWLSHKISTIGRFSAHKQ